MTRTSFDLSGRVALVTGGGSGLGLATVEGLGGAGARVILVGRDRSNLERARDGIRGEGGAAEIAVYDLPPPRSRGCDGVVREPGARPARAFSA